MPDGHMHNRVWGTWLSVLVLPNHQQHPEDGDGLSSCNVSERCHYRISLRSRKKRGFITPPTTFFSSYKTHSDNDDVDDDDGNPFRYGQEYSRGTLFRHYSFSSTDSINSRLNRADRGYQVHGTERKISHLLHEYMADLKLLGRS